jgi:hypothetical protein
MRWMFLRNEFCMRHVDDELRRIGARVAVFPYPFEYAGLYAAQQALCWAAKPEAFKPLTTSLRTVGQVQEIVVRI